MHYANGREAKIGDKVVGSDISGNPVAGVVSWVYPGTDTCNLQIIPWSSFLITATASKCLCVTDLAPEQPKSS